MAQSDPSHLAAPAPSPASARTSGYLRIAQERRGILIVDVENVVGQFNHVGLPSYDPLWISDKARRLAAIDRALAVVNLSKTNPLKGRPYAEDASIWADCHFTVIHAPSKPLTDDNGTRAWKDMTDDAIRLEIQAWTKYQEITDIFAVTHDVDFANALQATGKRVTLVTVMPERFILSTRLLQAADNAISVLWYNGAVSARALEKRGWWNKNNTRQVLEEMLRSWFEGGVNSNPDIALQLTDMQQLVQLLLSVCPEPVTWKTMRDAIHAFWSQEKDWAHLATPRTAENLGSSNDFENTDLILPVSQARACQLSVERVMGIMMEHEVLLYQKMPPHDVKHFFINHEHPAVQLLKELDFT